MSASFTAPGFDPFDPALTHLLEWALGDPENALIEVEREIVAKQGLRGFTSLAWHVVEGAEARYIPNWHIDAMCEHLEAVSRGYIRRLAIMVPPRSMKSLTVAVMWPAWDWIDASWRRFLFASYAHNLSIRDSVKCRRVLQSPWFRQRWGNKFRLTGDQNTKIRFENDKNGYRLATSVDGQLTGEGGDFVCCDDANNVRKAESEATRLSTNAWWDESMSTRLNDPNTGAYVLVQQRVNENDLMGHVLKKETSTPWTVLCLPAEYDPVHPQRWFRDPRKEAGELLWPARVSRPVLEALKIDLGPYAAAAQLQQRPAPREGGIFKRGWFEIVPFAPADTRWVRGWDLAASEKTLIKADPDYSASVLFGWSPSARCWFIGHAERFREEPHQTEQRILQRAEQDGPRVHIQMPQDPGQAGKAQAKNLLVLLSRFTVYADPVTGDKTARAISWAGKAGGGMIKIVKGDWNETFLTELTSFPTGAHDDLVDAASSAHDRLVNSASGIADFYEQQLRALGIDPSALKTPYQEQQERLAAEQAERDAAAKEKAAQDAPAAGVDMAKLMAALTGKLNPET